MIKFGGSVISDRYQPYTSNVSLLPKLIKKLSQYKKHYDIVLVLGGGSYGHAAVIENMQCENKAEIHWSALSMAHFRLFLECESHLRQGGVEFFPIPSPGLQILHESTAKYITSNIDNLLRRGLLPILTGGLDFCDSNDFKIVGSDEISAIFSRLLSVEKAIFITDSRGIYKANGRDIYHAITQENYREVYSNIYKSNKPDVTNGMLGKFQASLAISNANIPVAICNAEIFVSKKLNELFHSNSTCTIIHAGIGDALNVANDHRN